MRKDKRNLGETFIGSDIKVSGISKEEAQKSWQNSFKKGLEYLKKEIKDGSRSKRKNS